MAPLMVLFDLDGTLVDCAGAGRRALESAFRSVFGADGIAEASRRVRFEGRTDPAIVEALAEAAGIESVRLAALREQIVDRYVDALRTEMSRPDPKRRVMPGVPRLLDTLAARAGTYLGLLTGNIETGARIKLDAFGLNAYFPAGGFSSDHADRREIARLAFEKVSRIAGLEFARHDVVVVGDTELDVACARANGFRAVAVVSGWVPREKLETAAPDALFDDFTDLSRVMGALERR